MLKCCISGCGKQRSSSTKLKFFRLPSRHQVERLRLWRQAIQRANGGTGEVKGSARVCGDHFLSGMASSDPNSPDFVPSVFASSGIIPQKKRRRRRRRRTGHRRANTRQEENKSPPAAEVLVEDRSPVLKETDIQLPQEIPHQSASSLEEENMLTHLPAAETGATEKNTESFSPNQTSLSLIKSKIIAEMEKMRAVVLLKRIVIPQERFTVECELNKHQQREENNGQIDESSFPCNICGRSYATTHLLKRHKLLHVRDTRKCSTCGVVFCRRHNHVVFNPVVAVVPKIEEESSASEPEIEEKPLEDVHPEVSEQSQTDGRQGRALTVTPTQIIAGPTTPLPECSLKTVQLRPLMPKPTKEPRGQNQPQAAPTAPSCPTAFFQHPEFQGSLKMFSPQYLTSAFLDVKRNYQYIFSKSKTCEKFATKTEPHSVVLGESVQIKAGEELIAYDMEIEI